MKRRTLISATTALAATPAWVRGADAYPNKTVRLVIPFEPGGTVDLLGRVLAERMAAKFGHQVIVENKPGAGGTIAAQGVARSPADGHTLFLGSMGTQSMNGAIYPKLPFDPIRDFAPVTRLVNSSNLLLLHPSVPAKSVSELIALLRSKPGRLFYSTAGTGSFNHMSAVLFQMMADVKIEHVPYKSGGQALNAVLSGESQLVFQTIPPAIPFVSSGKLRAIAVCSKERHPLFPNLPTASESGLPGFEISTWYGLLAPAGTPANIVAHLNDALTQIITDPSMHKRLLDLGLEASLAPPKEFAAAIDADAVKWAKVVKAAGLKAD